MSKTKSLELFFSEITLVALFLSIMFGVFYVKYTRERFGIQNKIRGPIKKLKDKFKKRL